MRMDDRAICKRCGGSAHDFVRQHAGEITIQCVYCLAFAYVFGYVDIPEPKTNDGKYVLKYGRYKGMSIKSVANLGERGIEYLKMLASDTPKLADIINGHLDSRSTVSVTAASFSLQPEPRRSPSRAEADIHGSS